MILAPAGRVPSLLPRVEELVNVPTPSKWTTSEPERLYNLRTSPLYPGEDHQHPLSLLFCGRMSLTHPLQSRWTDPLVPLGVQLDFASLQSLQDTISHYPVTGEVQCEYQSWTMALLSLV